MNRKRDRKTFTLGSDIIKWLQDSSEETSIPMSQIVEVCLSHFSSSGCLTGSLNL